MKVKDILKNCAILLDDSVLANKVSGGVFNTQENQVINLLLECLQLTNTRIASEYILLKDVSNVSTSNGIVPLSDITSKKLFDVISIKREGFPLQFSIRGGDLYTQVGQLEIEYSYLPGAYDINSEISCYPGRISERVFAYGVVAEYLAIKGNVDDSAMWEEKFVKAMSIACSKHKEVVMPKRRWR